MRKAFSMQAGAGVRSVRPEQANDGRGDRLRPKIIGFGQAGQAGARAMGSVAFGRASGGFT